MLYARAVETTGTVQTVAFFAGNTSLGVVSNSSQVVVSNISSAPRFPLAWSNVEAGNYALTAVATDAKGLTASLLRGEHQRRHERGTRRNKRCRSENPRKRGRGRDCLMPPRTNPHPPTPLLGRTAYDSGHIAETDDRGIQKRPRRRATATRSRR